jgi:hypothetical protein
MNLDTHIQTQTLSRPPKSLRVIAGVVLLLGSAMIVYWTMYLVQRMPVGDIPVFSELVTAVLAFVAGISLWRRKPLAVPFSLALAGMWGYGVIGGIVLVLQHGLDFTSPFGALTDASLFPLILAFSIYMAIIVWRQRRWFQA